MPLPSNWGQYLGDGTATGGARDTTFTTQQGWDDALNWVKQFDPNASIQGTTTASGDGGQYINFNNALLPQNAMGGRGIEGAANVDALRDRQNYVGPRAQDANLGNIGSSAFAARSLTQRTGLLDILGPLLVGGFAGLAGGGLGLVGSALTKAPSLLAGFNGFGGGGGGGMSPEMQRVLQQLLTAHQGGGG